MNYIISLLWFMECLKLFTTLYFFFSFFFSFFLFFLLHSSFSLVFRDLTNQEGYLMICRIWKWLFLLQKGACAFSFYILLFAITVERHIKDTSQASSVNPCLLRSIYRESFCPFIHLSVYPSLSIYHHPRPLVFQMIICIKLWRLNVCD